MGDAEIHAAREMWRVRGSEIAQIERSRDVGMVDIYRMPVRWILETRIAR